MDTKKKDVKETIESSKSAEELLSNIDTLNPPIDEEELSNVASGIDHICEGLYRHCSTHSGKYW